MFFFFIIYLLLIRVAVQTYFQESEAKTPPVLNQKMKYYNTWKKSFFSGPANKRERGRGKGLAANKTNFFEALKKDPKKMWPLRSRGGG